MVRNEEVTDMIFRAGNGGDIFALMPGLAGSYDPDTCTCYQQVGQHSSADYKGCMKNSRAATLEEYKPLLKELEGQGYIVNPIKHATRFHRVQRIKQL